MGKPGLLEEGVHGLLNWKLPTTEAHKICFLCFGPVFMEFYAFWDENPPKNFFLSVDFLRAAFGHASDFHGGERSFME